MAAGVKLLRDRIQRAQQQLAGFCLDNRGAEWPRSRRAHRARRERYQRSHPLTVSSYGGRRLWPRNARPRAPDRKIRHTRT